MTRRRTIGDEMERGQALVEFALALPVFLMLVLGIFDVGRGIYVFNGVSEAARDIARATSVHPAVVLGQSAESLEAISTQKALVPSMADPVFACNDITGAATTHVPCLSGDYVKVTVDAAFTPNPLFGFLGSFTLSSSSSIEIP